MMKMGVQILPKKRAEGIHPGASRGYVALLVAAGLFLDVATPVSATSDTNLVFRYDTLTTTDDSVTFSFSQDPRAASAKFEINDDNCLKVTLANIGADVLVPDDVLTAVFFDLTDNPTLTPVSALLAPGSVVLFDPDGQPAGGVVGGEWAYWRRDNELPPPEPDQGLSSTGIDLVGPENLFPGDDLAWPPSPDGVQYGLTSINDDPYTGNSKVAWNEPTDNPDPLIKYSVVFTLSGLPEGFDVGEDISDVDFWYGTSRTPIPEPLTIVGVFMGLAGVGGYIRRRRNVPWGRKSA